MLTVNFKLFRIGNGDRFLDVGCGEGRHSFEAFRLGSQMVCSLDMDDLGLRKTQYVLHYMATQKVANGSWHVMFGDALNLPFKDASFDKIICAEVLEHVADEDRGIRELVRVLKPGGLLAVTVPTFLSESVYWALDEDYYNHPGGHVRKFKAQELMESLRRHDLAIYAIRYEHAFHTIYWLLRCIFGLKKEQARVPALYHKFLVLQIVTRSKFAQRMERIFNFIFPKSIVIYTRKI